MANLGIACSDTTILSSNALNVTQMTYRRFELHPNFMPVQFSVEMRTCRDCLKHYCPDCINMPVENELWTEQQIRLCKKCNYALCSNCSPEWESCDHWHNLSCSCCLRPESLCERECRSCKECDLLRCNECDSPMWVDHSEGCYEYDLVQKCMECEKDLCGVCNGGFENCDSCGTRFLWSRLKNYHMYGHGQGCLACLTRIKGFYE